MTREDEAKIRREGFPVNGEDAKRLLAFIDLFDASHFYIEAETIVKLEQLSERECVSCPHETILDEAIKIFRNKVGAKPIFSDRLILERMEKARGMLKGYGGVSQ